MKPMRRMIGFLLAILFMVSSACSNPINLTPTPESTGTFTPAVPPDQATPTSQPVLPSDTPAAVCASADAAHLLFTLDEAANPFALCFLYPADFTAQTSMIPNTYSVSGPPHGEGEPMAGSLSLSFEPAGSKSLEQFAADTVAAQAPGLSLALTPVTIGDNTPAMRVDGIPGITGTITLFIVHNDTAFTLTFMPADTIPDAVSDMQRLLDSVSSSWVFTR